VKRTAEGTERVLRGSQGCALVGRELEQQGTPTRPAPHRRRARSSNRYVSRGSAVV